MCKFDIAWVGTCKEHNFKDSEFCEKHTEMKCSVCGKQATKECDRTFTLVCGCPLCDDPRCREVHNDDHNYANRNYNLFEPVPKLTKEQELRDFIKDQMYRSKKYSTTYNWEIDRINFVSSRNLFWEIEHIPDSELWDFLKERIEKSVLLDRSSFYPKLKSAIGVQDLLEKLEIKRQNKSIS